MLRSQLDKASESEAGTLRELQRTLDRVEFDNTRLREKLSEVESKHEVGIHRLVGLEKDLLTAQDGIHKKDRQVRDERQRAENMAAALEDVRRRLDEECDTLRIEVHREKILNSN